MKKSEQRKRNLKMASNNTIPIKPRMSCNKVPSMMSLKGLKRKNQSCSKRKSKDTKPKITDS